MLRALQVGAAVATIFTAFLAGCSSASDTAPGTPGDSSAVSQTTVATPLPIPPRPAVIGAKDWEAVGTSVQGRPILARTFGRGPRSVVFVGGIHGDEAEGAHVTERLPVAFEAAGLGEDVTLTIVEDANPDGRAAGTRGNANGVDVNRNFPASNFDSGSQTNGGTPLSQPESRALVETIDRVQPDLVIVVHAWTGKEFVNFDGPARELVERFSASSGLPVEASTEFAPTPGSLGSYVGRDRGIPVLTIEVLKGSEPIVVWDRLRTALLQAIGG